MPKGLLFRTENINIAHIVTKQQQELIHCHKDSEMSKSVNECKKVSFLSEYMYKDGACYIP